MIKNLEMTNKRNYIIAGNWKMNLNLKEAESFIDNYKIREGSVSNQIEKWIFPSFVNLYPIKHLLQNSSLNIGAQNCHADDSGAFTGEVSMDMLSQIGIAGVIIGHSERRSLFKEDHEFLKRKIDKALKHGAKAFFCVGETEKERDDNDQTAVVKKQLQDSLFHLSEEQLEHIVIAYEPVWAIGTGKTASPEQADEMHHYIRSQISEHYSEKSANQMPILYGGSVKPENAESLLSQDNIDGALIGGASLVADKFYSIIETAHSLYEVSGS